MERGKLLKAPPATALREGDLVRVAYPDDNESHETDTSRMHWECALTASNLRLSPGPSVQALNRSRCNRAVCRYGNVKKVSSSGELVTIAMDDEEEINDAPLFHVFAVAP